MRHSNRWLGVLPIIVSVYLAGCGRQAASHETVEPAHVEHIDGSDLSRLTLTDKAMERLDIRLGAVSEERIGPSLRKVVPYGAVIYDPQGHTWVYTSPERNTFVRAPIDVDRINNDMAILNDGPSVGTQVASVGGGLLYGTEFEVGH